MNESQKTSVFLKKVQKLLPGAVIFKHNDRITAGIPDCSITLRGKTIWIEFKDGTEIPPHQRILADKMKNVWFYDHKTKIIQRFGAPQFEGEVAVFELIEWLFT